MTAPDVVAGRRGAPATAPAVVVAAATLTGATYLALGWVRFSTGRAGNFDLGIFAQAAQHWAAGRLPASSIRNVDSLFADHFSPVTVLFGLGWWIWPDPRSLIVVQSLALAAAVAVITAAAIRLLPVRRPALPALLLALGAGLAKGMISAASFDVHETTLGTPLVAGLCWGLLARRFRPTLWCAAGLLLVKEDLGLTVAVAGVVWWWLTRERRRAAVLVALGLAGLVLANAVVIWAAPDHRSPYLQFLTGASGNPQGLAGAAVPGGVRWAPSVLFVLTAGIVGFRSPIAWLAVPTLAWRAASSNTSYWQTYFHYDAIIVPIAALALLDVLRGLGVRTTPRAARAQVALAVVGLGWAAGMGIVKIVSWQPWVPGRYVLAPRLRDAAELVRQVPRGVAVVAQQDLGSVVVARVDVRMLASTVPARGTWVLLTPDGSQLGAPEAAKRAWLEQQRARPDVVISTRGDVVLVRLPGMETVQL